MKQINNLKIKYSKLYENFRVVAPDGRVLEEFDTEKKAINWAKEIKDFVLTKDLFFKSHQRKYDDKRIWAEIYCKKCGNKLAKRYKEDSFFKGRSCLFCKDCKLMFVKDKIVNPNKYCWYCIKRKHKIDHNKHFNGTLESLGFWSFDIRK